MTGQLCANLSLVSNQQGGKMTTEQVFEKLWSMGDKLYNSDPNKFLAFKQVMSDLSQIFPEEEWDN